MSQKKDQGAPSARKHTPGPWGLFTIASPAGTSYRVFRDGTTAVDIAHIPMQLSGDGSNAALIAAAPELADALEDFLAWSEHAPAPIDPDEQAEEARERSRITNAALSALRKAGRQ